MGKMALLLLLGSLGVWAEPQYYKHSNSSTWEEARKHCQLCYKELVSLNSENIQLIVQNLTNDYWVGLREDLNGTMLWSVWSNGDPVTFQNWYPGHPKILQQIPPTPTTPTTTATPMPRTSTGPEPLGHDHICRIELEDLCRNLTNITELYIYNGSEHRNEFETPVTEPQPTVTAEPEPVIKNPCTALLSFGMWMERNCSGLLPYICYEDRFYGSVNFSNVTLKSASFNWSPGPGNIDFYRLKLSGDINLTVNTSYLFTDISNLTQGTLYQIQVFPVKCGRDLNPQNISFYTKPDVIQTLSIKDVGTNSVCLSWVRPVGNHDFYSVEVVYSPNITCNSTTESCLVTGLSPGTFYQFNVYAEVKDQSIVGDPTNISSYTRPNKVVNLRVLYYNNTSIVLAWNKSEEVSLEFQVVVDVGWQGNHLLTQNTTSTNVIVDNLTPGTIYFFTVVPQVPDLTLNGENVTIPGFTIPSPISNLNLLSNESAITASWTLPVGNATQFNLTIQSDDTNQKWDATTNLTQYTFNVNKAAASYTVTVWTVVGNIKSESVNGSRYTLPVRPGCPSVLSKSNTSITIQWEVPPDLDNMTTQFLVTYQSSFWQFKSSSTIKGNKITVDNLQPGTYYNFSIQTVADNKTSDAVSITNMTVPRRKNLTISIQCSSNKTLYCENANSSFAVIQQFQEKLKSLLEGNVYYLPLPP